MDKAVNFRDRVPYISNLLTATETHEEDFSVEKISYTYRTIVLTYGSMTVIMNGSKHICHIGDTIFLIPGQVYTTIFHPPVTKCVNLVLDYSEGQSAKKIPPNSHWLFLAYTSSKIESKMFCEKLCFRDLPAFNSSFVISGIPDAAVRIEKMYQIYMSDNIFSEYRLASAALDFIADLAEYASGVDSRNNNELAHRVLEYIDAHFKEHLSCQSVAEYFSYHPSYINRIIRAYTGRSLHEYIMRRKIREATFLLVQTDKPMTEIAYDLSFCDSSHFSKAYQANTGLTPTEIRNMALNGSEIIKVED